MSAEKGALITSWINSGVLKDKEIISAFQKVPRENFVLKEYKEQAYLDEPLPILKNQTISQPTTVAIMTQALAPKAGNKILEIGTGSGYQAAILSEIVGKKGKVYTIERIKGLFEFAKKNLKKHKNVVRIFGDGSKGYKEAAPFSRIIITAAANEIPNALFEQLKEKGILL